MKPAAGGAVHRPGVPAPSTEEPVDYNSLTGGLPRADRSLELDERCSSYPQSVQCIDDTAPPGARIAVIGVRQVAKNDVRPDLLVDVRNRLGLPQGQPYYILASTFDNWDLGSCRNRKIVFGVQRDGALLSDVRKVDPPQTCK